MASEIVHSAFDQDPVTGIVIRVVKPGGEAAFERLLKQVTGVAKERPGFLGSEIFPPVPGVQNAYIVLYRFDTADHLRGWLHSRQRQQLFQEIEPYLERPTVEHFLSHQHRPAGTVTAVIGYRIRPDQCEAFARWRSEMQEATRAFEGYLGTEYYEGLHEDRPEHISVLRFASQEQLDAWLTSPTRAAMLEKGQPLVEGFHLRGVNSGFEAWFGQTKSGGAIPARWRQALLLLCVLGPLMVLQRGYYYPLVEHWPALVALYAGLAINLALMTWLIMPKVTTWMRFWLTPPKTAGWKSEALGLLVLALVSVGVAVLCTWFPFL